MRRAASVRRIGVLAAALCATAGALPGPLSVAGAAVARHPPRIASACSPLFGCPGVAPAVIYDSPTDVSSSSATLHGIVDPDGLATSYDFEYAPTAATGQLLSTASVQLPAGVLPQSVTATITGLTPETSYSVLLVATNSRGARSDGGEFDTAVPAMPPLSVGDIRADHTVVVEGATVTMTARLSGPLEFYRTYFGAPDAQLQSSPHLAALSLPAISDVSVPGSDVARFLPVTPTRNTRFRVRVGANVSSWLQVYVDPLTELYTTPALHRHGYLKLAYSAAGALLHGYHRGPVASFYRGASRAGPFRRVARARFRRSGASVYARATIRAQPGGFYVACTRRPIIPGMGRPFHDPHCGNATLH